MTTWNPRSPTDALTAAEAERLRAFVKQRGEQLAAKELGLNAATVNRAALGIAVHRLTVDVIRRRLEGV